MHSFGVRLWRLLATRRPTVQDSVEEMTARLATEAGVPLSGLRAVLDGAAPGPELIRPLGPALGIRDADMFVLAGLAVPPDLASAWPTRYRDVGTIIRTALRLSPESRTRLDELVRSLPALPPPATVPADDYPDWPGALLVRLARNRNIRPQNAQVLLRVGGGPYVSDSTIAMLARGRVAITPLFVTGFARVLGYAPADLVALTGVGPVASDAPAHPAHAELATLAWNARHLDSTQISEVLTTAETWRAAERTPR